MVRFEAFSQMESDNWSRASIAENYVKLFAFAADQAIAPLISVVEPKCGQQALDICCGQGNVTEALTATGAEAHGLDFSPVMLEMARQRTPGTPFVLGDAQDLPFPDESFDVVVSGFGICHVPDQPRALAEACRVLRSGGRLGMTVWCGPEQSASFEILYGAIRDYSDPAVTLPSAPDFHQFAHRHTATDLLHAAGFKKVAHRILDCYWELRQPDGLCELFEKATARLGSLEGPAG